MSCGRGRTGTPHSHVPSHLIKSLLLLLLSHCALEGNYYHFIRRGITFTSRNPSLSCMIKQSKVILLHKHISLQRKNLTRVDEWVLHLRTNTKQNSHLVGRGLLFACYT
ncbi:hypothetical protein MLD38_016636 [Melastoma candidum]|uniref:Uncharacterized protein n=1 Tax=Melastoma candidum TaxID=119954 RepID=A0ACB9QN68_9MYRT|nr:hypothetical protein MLD38_016636 [Melastoma candidum]